MGPNYAMTTLFVVPTGNTLPTGSARTFDLNPVLAQFGVFDAAGVAATTGTLGTSKSMLLAQGRLEDVDSDGNRLGTKKAGPIFKEKVKNFYKVTASATSQEQVITINNFAQIHPDETISLSVRLRSRFIDSSFAQAIGLLKSITYNTPCGECGDAPCTELTPEQIEDMVDFFVGQGNAHSQLSQFVTFSKTGSGATAALVLTAKPVPQLKPNSPWMYTNSFELDKVSMNAYFYTGVPVTSDMLVHDRCKNIADVATTQKPIFPRGLKEQIRAEEIRFNSYQNVNKTMFDDPDWNNFISYADASTYTQYFIEFEPNTPLQYVDHNNMTEWARIAAPTGQEANIEALLEAFLGAFPEIY
jgi:hypothetical protein